LQVESEILKSTIPKTSQVLHDFVIAQAGEPAPAQAQVGEVSDVNRNVNIVNSPVVS